MPKLKIALIDDDHARADYIKNSLLENDFEVVAYLIVLPSEHETQEAQAA